MKQDEVRVGEEGADEEGDDVPHPVVGVEEQLAAGLREVAQAVAGVEHLRVTKKRPVKYFEKKVGISWEQLGLNRKADVFTVDRFAIGGGVIKTTSAALHHQFCQKSGKREKEREASLLPKFLLPYAAVPTIAGANKCHHNSRLSSQARAPLFFHIIISLPAFLFPFPTSQIPTVSLSFPPSSSQQCFSSSPFLISQMRGGENSGSFDRGAAEGGGSGSAGLMRHGGREGEGLLRNKGGGGGGGSTPPRRPRDRKYGLEGEEGREVGDRRQGSKEEKGFSLSP